MNYRTVRVRKDPDCAVCGKNPTVTELIDYEAFCGAVSEEAEAAVVGSTISAKDLAAMQERGDNIFLVDVREPNEYETVNLGGKLMPLATLQEHLSELDRSSHIVAHCRSGHRSAKAVALLRESGFEDAWSLNGGLMNWIDRIDGSLPRY